MKKASIFIVEDEALIADHLAVCLEELGYEVSGIADNASDALEGIRLKSPDLVLMDIQLRGPLDGVDLTHQINREKKTPVIFLTSNSDTATVERLKFTEPAGFISKPYNQADLASNISIALYKTQKWTGAAVPSPEAEDHFFIRDKHALIKVRFCDIHYAEAMDNYTRLHTSDKRHILSSTLKTVEERLTPHGFLRVHRSFLVNISHIDQILPRNIIIAGAELPLSETARKQLMDFITTF